MSSNSSASEEQLPEVFRRLGKTVPPRTKRSYSGSQPPQDTGFRIVRQTEQPYYQQHSPNNFHHASYNDMVGYSSTPPPLYYRPQMSSESNAMGYHTTYSPNGNNSNSNSTANNNRPIPVSYHSPSSSVSSTPPPASAPAPAPSATAPSSLPQHGLSFIPKDAHPNPNPIISFVRNPNAGAMPATAYSTPYQFFGNGSMNQANVNNGQQVLHPPPPIATSVPVPNAATAPATSSLDSPPVSKATSSGTSVTIPKSSNSKKDSATSSDKALSSSSPTSRKSEQKKPQRHVSSDNHDASDDSQDEAPVHQRDILAKSIKIIASRPLGSTDKKSGSASRKHTRQSDSEADSGSNEEIVVNRKIVVVSDDMDTDRRSNERESSPIRKKPRRLISPTIPKRRRSLSDTSDNGNIRITKSRYTVRSPSPMSHDRRTWSRSRSRSRSPSRSRSHSRSCLRTRSRSRSRSPSGQTRRHRRSLSSTGRKRDYSPGTSSDEERAPFLRGDIDRYIPDYNRRPLPPQWRDRSSSARKLTSSSTTETNGIKKSSISLPSPPPATKKPVSNDSKTSINDRLNRNSLSSKPKDLRSYPPLGTSFVSLNSPRSRAEMETSAPSKQASVKKSTPIISHRIITKPSPVAARAETTSSHTSLASDTQKNASPAAKAAQLPSQPNSIKPDHVENDDNIMPIKQEIITESTREKPKPVARSNEARNASAMTGIETPSKNTAPAMSMNGSSSAISVNQGHASSDTSSQKTNVVNAPKIDYDPETPYPNQARILSAFSDTPIANGIETHAASSLKPLVKGKSTDTSTAATATMPTTTLNGPSQPTKRVTITSEARAAIRKRAAKEQERLDQERLRQLDIDDRDDIVMDIACPSQPRSSAVMIVNNDTTAIASEMLTNNNTRLIQTSIATAADLNNHHAMTSAAQHINDNTTGSFITTSDEQVTLIVNHPTSARDMTSHENVPSSDTTTVGTNSAFTNLVSSNDKMSVPDGCTTEQTKSMPTQNTPPASTLKAPVAVAATKPATKKSSNKRLPTPWKVKMNDSGDIYYHNPVTGEETFVRPE